MARAQRPRRSDADPRSKDVWAFALDGTATQLTFTGNDEEQPSWAPDGTHIAFKRSDEVFVRDVTTDAAPLRLTNKAVSTENNTQPAWSPDGASIVFRTNRADPTRNVGDVWIMNADGTDERPLIVQPGDQRYPSVSPDGRHIAYTSHSEGGTADIWVADADGTGAHSSTTAAARTPRRPGRPTARSSPSRPTGRSRASTATSSSWTSRRAGSRSSPPTRRERRCTTRAPRGRPTAR